MVTPFGHDPSWSPFGVEGASLHPGRGLLGLSEQLVPVLYPLLSRPVTLGAVDAGWGGTVRSGGAVVRLVVMDGEAVVPGEVEPGVMDGEAVVRGEVGPAAVIAAVPVELKTPPTYKTTPSTMMTTAAATPVPTRMPLSELRPSAPSEAESGAEDETAGASAAPFRGEARFPKDPGADAPHAGQKRAEWPRA